MTLLARRGALVGRRRKLLGLTKLGGNENGSTANTGKASAGRRESWPQTIAVSGTITQLSFKLRSAVPGITAVWLGVIADDGTGKPIITNVLAQGSTTVGVKEAGVVTVTGLSLSVVAGEKVHFAAMAIGGELTYYGESPGAVTTHESTTTGTEIKGVTGWETFTEVGPVYFAASGEAKESEVGAPTLTLNATDHQTVEWNAVGTDSSGYLVAMSLEPAGTPGRKVAQAKQAKGANPQHVKPVVGTAFGEGTTITPTAGSTVYVSARVEPSGPFSSEVAVTMPGAKEEEGGTGGTGFLKGIELEGSWPQADKEGDAVEAGLNMTRLNKPTRATIELWEKKGITIVYLYAYDVGGENKSGVKAINRAAWVADAIEKIKAAKPKYFECLNEPAQDAFWGSGSTSSENADAYNKLLKLLKEEVIAKIPAAERPKILASLDGGKSGEKRWAELMKTADSGFTAYFDIATCHPYGGTGERAKAKEGHRDNVEAIRTLISAARPFMITEVGFPTISATGDSLAYSESEAAANFASLLAWAKGLSWMVGLCIFGYRDGTGGNGYGQWKGDDTPKLAVPKIKAA